MSIDPITLMSIGRGVALASTVVSTIGQMNAASYQAAVAARNADIMEQNARKAIEDAQREQQDWGQEARGQLGSIIASMSASGAMLGSGTTQERTTGTRGLLARDAERIREEGNIRSEGFRQGAADSRAEGALARSRGRSALFGGLLSAGSSFISDSVRISRARQSLIS